MRTGKKQKIINTQTPKLKVQRLEQITQYHQKQIQSLNVTVHAIQVAEEHNKKVFQSLVEEFNRLNGELAKHRKDLVSLEISRNGLDASHRTMASQIGYLRGQIAEQKKEQKAPSEIILRVTCDRPAN